MLCYNLERYGITAQTKVVNNTKSEKKTRTRSHFLQIYHLLRE